MVVVERLDEFLHLALVEDAFLGVLYLLGDLIEFLLAGSGGQYALIFEEDLE